MTWQIGLIFVLLVITFISFVRERVPPDLTALGLFVILVAAGLLPVKTAFSVFANVAPFTIGAMFVLSAALVKCGAIERLAGWVKSAGRLPYPIVIFILVAGAGGISAFINNTPVVVVLLPVVLGLAKQMKLTPSKLLIPLSYAAVLGGTVTLIGTSTNLVVNGMVVERGLPRFQLFELAWLGLPVTIVGAIYMACVGRRLLPSREMLSSILSDEERREYITEAFVHLNSPAIGRTLTEAGLTPRNGVRLLEIVRQGIAVRGDPTQVQLLAGDRLVMSCRMSGIATTRAAPGIDLVSEWKLGLEQIAAHEGSLVEAVVNPHSFLVGRTVREINFRQRYRLIALAVHRKGKNVREQIDTLPIHAGDVLLLMGTNQAIDALSQGDDLVLFDRARMPSTARQKKTSLVLAVIGAVILTASLDWVPIELGALAGCVIVCVTGCLTTREAYESIEWPMLFLIFGMLAMGLAMESTGAAAWLAGHVVDGVNHVAAPEYKALVMLTAVYGITMVLTELLSNNAVAALMLPIVIGIAQGMGVDSRPFIVAVMFAASLAFATPIGYQTNTYVYGIGGYRFSDFVKIGLPLNFLCWLLAILIIPRVWPF